LESSCIVLSVSISFISAIIFVISLHLLLLSFAYSWFSKNFQSIIRLFVGISLIF
jgi:hypothetical protein